MILNKVTRDKLDPEIIKVVENVSDSIARLLADFSLPKHSPSIKHQGWAMIVNGEKGEEYFVRFSSALADNGTTLIKCTIRQKVKKWKIFCYKADLCFATLTQDSEGEVLHSIVYVLPQVGVDKHVAYVVECLEGIVRSRV